MEITPEMDEMLKRQMTDYFAAYWQKHATPEQEEKRKADGKTFDGAYAFVRSVAEHYKNNANGGASCVAIPDDLAYWLLMHYMENEPEGAKYKTKEELEAEAKAKEDKEKRKRAAAEKRAAMLSKDSLIPVSADDVMKSEAEAKAAKEEEKKQKQQFQKEVQNAEAVEKQVQMTLL